MNNVVDRVPTQVLSNGAVRWEQFDSSGNSLGYVYLKRADEPTEAGTPLNKALFDSIKTDIQSRLLTANKATQAQAEAGSDNTKYMTSLRVKQAIEAFKNIKYHSITLSKSAETTVNISNYITDTTIKLEIVINADFEDSHGGVSFTGTRFTSAGKSTGSSSLDLDHTNQKANLTIAIFPKQHKISVIGIGNPAVSSETIFNSSYSYETLTSIQIGRLDSSTYLNYDEPASIIQYLN